MDTSTRPPLRARADSRAARGATEPSGSGANGSSKGSSPSTEETLATLTRLADDLRALARVRLEVLREHVLEAGTRGRRALWMAVVAAAATVTAVVLLVRGASEGLAGLYGPGRAWLADLTTGAIILVAVVVAHHVREAGRRRRRMRKLKSSLAPRGRPEPRATEEHPHRETNP